MAKIKYTGTSDYRVLEKGENFGGRLAEPLSKRVVFSPENNHLVDSEEAGLSADALSLLLDHEAVVFGESGLVPEDQDTSKTIKEFKDVSDLKIIPPSLNQQIYRGIKSGVHQEQATEEPEGERPREQRAVRASGTGAGGAAGGAGGGGARAGVGGSTDGAGGDTT